jgi:FkbM family methyltransferase
MVDKVTPNADSQRRWQEGEFERVRYEYDLQPEDVVFDIGAYRGEFSEEIIKRYGCRIVAIEPTDSILSAEWMFVEPHGEPGNRVRVINKAAGIGNAPIKFGGQFYYTSAFEDGPTREYPAFDINSVLSEYEEIALCKINIEGLEYDLLRRIFEDGLQSRVKNFQVQFHEIEGQPYEEWYEEIMDTLVKTHFPTYLFPFCWENWRRR